jgi:hypothetical protein
MPADKKDFLWISIASLLILLASSIPTWAGYQAETPGLRFRGIFYDSQDYAVHLGTMAAGGHGEWAYQFRFTTEPHRPAYLKMFYVALGHLSSWFGTTPDLTFQAARWFFGLLALFALYGLLKRAFPGLFWARYAFLLAVLGSGLGWLQLLFGWTSTAITPIDFWLVDDYVFFSLAVFPHFAFVTAGMCLALSLWLSFLNTTRWISVIGISLTAILIQLVNPIAFATVDVALLGGALFSWWQAKKIRTEDIAALLMIALAQMPLLAYNFVVLGSDPLWSQFTAQNQTLSPPPDYYLWGFALFWPPAILGMAASFREKSPVLGAALFWVTSGFLLAYIPFYIQRRFLQDVTIPLAILGIAGLIRLFQMLAARYPGLVRWRSSLAIVFLFFASLSSVQLILGRTLYLQTHPASLYYPRSLDAGFDWFRLNAHEDDFVLASETTSQLLVQKAGLRAYFGHEMETLGYKTKQRNVQAFFDGRQPGLASAPIKWVVYGPSERVLYPDFRPPANLRLVYDSGQLQIFEVK